MDNTRGPMNFDKPEGFDNFVAYAEADRNSFGAIRTLKDSLVGITPKQIVAILSEYVENSKFENCYPNKGYCEALGINYWLFIIELEQQ